MRLVLIMLLSLVALAGDTVQEVKAFWDQCVKLEQAFDPACIEVYADDAFIQNTRRYPNGKTRVVTLTGAQFKALARSTLDLAKQRGDTSTYSNLKFKAEKDGSVTITMTRFSNLKKYSSPQLTVVAKRDGKWMIVRELSESRP
ncbi:MAG: hypothetical protein AMXMBFR33_10530 [Candidatus Xenobia bacterium]